MQFVERTPWIPSIHADFHIGVDGISMPLILLTTFTTVLIVIASWTNVAKRIAQYMGAFLILEGLMIGVFASLDAALFYNDRCYRGVLGAPASKIAEVTKDMANGVMTSARAFLIGADNTMRLQESFIQTTLHAGRPREAFAELGAGIPGIGKDLSGLKVSAAATH